MIDKKTESINILTWASGFVLTCGIHGGFLAMDETENDWLN